MGAPSQYRGLMIGVAQKLKEESSSKIHLYCSTLQEVNHYKSRASEYFESITCQSVHYSAVNTKISNDKDLWRIARENESWLGQSYNNLSISDRHFGRGFALGGYYHPRSRYSNADYRSITHAYNVATNFWKKEIREKKPDLIVWGDRVCIAAAQAENIEVRLMAGSRYQDLHFWSVNEFWENPAIEYFFHKASDEDGAGLKIETPYHSHVINRKHFMSDISLSSRLKKITYVLAQYAYWKLRGYEKAKGYYLSEQVAFHLRVRRQARDLQRGGMLPLSSLKGKRFVFYPLQTEPETSLQTLSPEYFFQLETIASVARDLPAGVILAVKETFAGVGRRPDNFYGQIREFKNVELIEMMELGLEVASQAEAVVTINGTAGLEAAVIGKPVIVFGHHNLYEVLPNVTKVSNDEDLKKCLKLALSGSINPQKNIIAGQRFLRAIIDTSFDLQSYDYRNPDVVNPEVINDAYIKLLESLEDPV